MPAPILTRISGVLSAIFDQSSFFRRSTRNSEARSALTMSRVLLSTFLMISSVGALDMSETFEIQSSVRPLDATTPPFSTRTFSMIGAIWRHSSLSADSSSAESDAGSPAHCSKKVADQQHLLDKLLHIRLPFHPPWTQYRP